MAIFARQSTHLLSVSSPLIASIASFASTSNSKFFIFRAFAMMFNPLEISAVVFSKIMSNTFPSIRGVNFWSANRAIPLHVEEFWFLPSQSKKEQKSLYNAWTTTSKLLESVRTKRTELQLLRQNLKLISILKGFMRSNALSSIDYSLSGATEALKVSTLRLPVVCGSRADVLKLKDAICSAINVMQAMTSSICSLSPRVAELNSLVAELGSISANEFVLLNQCKDLLSAMAAMQVTECSMRTHISQLNRLSSLA
ncbi:QWRF motif-containing protein 9-like [Hibiscus syriacus]|uniref:QWRF motif-containing protein 9-like n=1 Tax=Hibiscus syriacus TaxID=106335 RepID=UPI00192214DB|nr:QWRF motif-containing protein 9-like [Hibiscus syriacus]